MSGVIRRFLRQWPTPENEPTGVVCRLIYIPDDERIMAAVDGALSLVLNGDYWRDNGYPIEDTVWQLQTMFSDYLGSQGDCPVEVQEQSITAIHSAVSGTNGGASVANTDTILPFGTINRVNTTDGTLTTNKLTIPAGTWRIRARHALFQSSGANIADSVVMLKITQGILTQTHQSANMRNVANQVIMPEIDRVVSLIVDSEVWLEYRTTIAQANTGLGRPMSSGLDEFFGEIRCTRPYVVTP